MSVYIPGTAHIRLKVKGTPECVAAFHFIAGKLDPDYPSAPAKLMRQPGVSLLCPLCNGLIYATPNLTPLNFKALAKQINDDTRLKGHCSVKIVMYNTKCPGGCGPCVVTRRIN